MHAVRTGCGFSRFICLCQGTRAEVTELLMSIGLDNFLEGSNLLGDLGVLHARGPGLGNLELALVEGLALHLPLGRLGHEVGWKYQDIVAALEAKRKVKGEAFHKGKLEVAKARAACMK